MISILIMLRSIFGFLIISLFLFLVVFSAWIELFYVFPEFTETLNALLNKHPVIVGAMIVLSSIATHADFVAFWDAFTYRAVGAKAKAQRILGGY